MSFLSTRVSDTSDIAPIVASSDINSLFETDLFCDTDNKNGKLGGGRNFTF